MPYHQAFFSESDTGGFAHITTAEEHIVHTYSGSRSPFVAKRAGRIVRKWGKIIALRCLKYLFGIELYAKDLLGPLKSISPEAIELLEWLFRHRHIKKVEINQHTPGSPVMATFDIVSDLIQVPDGSRFRLVGSVGNGIDFTLNRATNQALAEFIERLSTAAGWWERSDVLRKSPQQLRAGKKHHIDPLILQLWKKQYQKYEGRTDFSSDTQFTWVKGHDFLSRKKILVPASCAYTFFSATHKEEPVLRETNSNGAAAHLSLDKAEKNAVLELIERDAFLQAWYHQKQTFQLSLDSMAAHFGEFASLFQILKSSSKLDLTVLDITSDLQIPTFCAVLCNQMPDHVAVGVSAAAHVDPSQAIRKVLLESCSFLSWTKIVLTEAQKINLLDKFNMAVVDSFTERKNVWSQQESIAAVEWFTKPAARVDYIEVIEKYPLNNISETDFIKRQLKEKKISVAMIKYQNKLTKQSGLTVVRAVSPELIPMFFNEHNLPYALERFTHNSEGTKVELQTIPHPFI